MLKIYFRLKDHQSYLPFVISCIVFGILFIMLFYNSINSNGSLFIYPFDDAYIHMNIARNLAFNGSWGINSGEFASASSSILYTLLLAISFKIFTFNIYVPLLINFISAILLLKVIDKWSLRNGLNGKYRLLILLAVILLVPLPTLVLSGMEHTLHLFLTFLFITSFSENLSDNSGLFNSKNYNNSLVSIYIYAALLTSIRYEGIFVIFISCLLLLYKRKILFAVALGFVALIPIIVFGSISLYKGSYFFPNSVLLKSSPVPFTLAALPDFIKDILFFKFIGAPHVSMIATQRIILLLPIIILHFWSQLKINRALFYSLSILFAVTVLHLSFAATGTFYRYEAYLIGVFVAFTLVTTLKFGVFKQLITSTAIFFTLFVTLLFSLPIIMRSGAVFSRYNQASINIFEQQYQIAEYLNRYNDKAVVAANDIGAISLFTNTKVIDLWGLGNIEIARSRRENRSTSLFYDSLVRREKVKVAIIYDSWFDKEVYKKWIKVATWKINNNVVCGDDIVSFYTLNEDDYIDIKRSLKLYQNEKLPVTVNVVYY